METSIEDGLTVSYDEEQGIITFEWNEETHPQYNYLAGLTSEQLSQSILNLCNEYLDNTEQAQDQGTQDDLQV